MEDSFDTVYYTGDCDTEDLKGTYDHVEYYDSVKNYPKGVFEANYIGRVHNYTFALHKGPNKSIVVAQREYTKEELEKVQDFCECPACVRAWYNPMKYLYCRHCYGCVTQGVGIAQEARVKAAYKKAGL
jgi:hypothetical protein